MASKINTKFALILVVAVVCAGGLIGGMYVLNERNNSQRNIKRAEEALAAGDIEKAFGYYGRAAHKEPGNLTLLNKLDELISQLTAPTELKARERYQERLQILRQAARHNPTNVDAHLRILRELHTAGRIFPDPNSFVTMGSAADDMWSGVSDVDPRRGLARCYRAISRCRLLEQRTTDELIESEHEVQSVVDAAPDNDFAWASLVITQVTIGEKYRNEGRSKTALDQQYKRIDQTVANAMKAVPDGRETAYMNLRWLVARRAINDTAVSEDEIQRASDHLAKLLNKDCDPGYFSEAIDLLASSTQDGVKRAIAIVQEFVDANPTAIDKRIRLAKLHYFQNDFDAATREARLVFDSEPLTTSFLAQMQVAMKQEAAGVMVDVANRRLFLAPEEAKPELLKALEEARNVLATVVTRAGDPQLLQADAKIAFAKADYNRAASLFEQVIHATSDRQVDREVLLYASESLERIGQVGLAYERLTTLMKVMQGGPDWVRVKAQMEFRMGRFDTAAETLATLPQAELERPDIQEMIAEIKRRKDSPVKLQDEDPVYAALNQASAALNRGDLISARSTLQSALNQSPDNVGLLQVLAQVELRDGQNGKAREYVDKALALAPNDQLLKRIDAVLKNEDPILAAEQYHAEAFQDEFARSLSLSATLTGLARQQSELAAHYESKGDAEAAAKAKAIVERAKASADASERRATELNPDHRDLIEYKFLKALEAKDWPQAEHFVIRARELNIDQADGMFFRGRYEFFRGNYQEAVRALESASDKLSYSSFVWRTLAFAYQNLKNDGQALRAFEQAYKCNPNDVIAAKAYVNLLLRLNEPIRALAVLQPLRRLNPQDGETRNMWLELEAQVGDRALVIRTRRNLHKDNPRDPNNVIRLAQLLTSVDPSRELLVDASGNALVSETRWERLTLQEREQHMNTARAQWKSEADAMLKSLIALNDNQLEPSSGANITPAQWKLSAVSARANLLREEGQVNEGERVLREFISTGTDQSLQAQMFVELGRYQAKCGHFTEALATMHEALKHQNPELRAVDQELVGLYIQLNLFDDAIKHLDQLIAFDSNNPRFVQQKAECLLKSGKFDESEQLIKDLTKAKGDDYVSTMLLASIAQVRAEEALSRGDHATADKKFAEQRDALTRSETQYPSDYRARVLLAHSWLAEYRRNPTHKEPLDEALRVLDRAEKATPGAWETLLARVAVLREKKEHKHLLTALSDLKRYVEKYPDATAPRRELVQLHLDLQDPDAAIAVVDDAIRRNPTLAVWHEAKGDMHRVGKRDFTNAIMAYEKADDLAKKSTTLAKLVETALLMPQPRCAEIAKRLSERPDDMATVPFLREAYARVLKCQQLDEQAQEQARLAYLRRREIITQGLAKPNEIGPWYEVLTYLFPGQNVVVDASAAENFLLERCNPTPDIWDLVSISRMYFLAGNGARAIEVQERAIAQCPPSDTKLRARFTLDLANFYTSLQKSEQASAAYQQTLQLDPNNIEALNNLSYLLSETMGEPIKALPYAERAVQLAPGNASILDTLGWTHSLAGNHEKAKLYLQDAVKLDPAMLSTVVHFAEVLYKVGDLDGAQRQLDNAVKLSPDPATQQKIDKLKDDIRRSRSSGR